MRRIVLGLAMAGVGLALVPGLLTTSRTWAQVPAAPVTAAPGDLARFVPQEGLMAFVKFDGLDARADAWHATAAYQVLNATPTGAMLEDLFTQAATRVMAGAPAGGLTGAEVFTLIDHVARNGLAGGLSQPAAAGAPPGSVVVLRGIAAKETRPLLGKVLGAMMGKNPKAQAISKGPRRVVQVTPPTGEAWTWWTEKDDLVLAFGPATADAVIDALTGAKPSAAALPLCDELSKAEGAFQPVAIAFLDPTGLPADEPSGIARAFQQAGVKRLDFRWGFEGPALMSVARIEAPAPRSGALLALLDQPSFDLKSMPPIPAAATEFTVLSLDLAKTYENLTTLIQQATPQAADQVAAFERTFEERSKHPLKQDVLPLLGPKVAFYSTPQKSAGGLGALTNLTTVLQVPRTTILVEIKDPARFNRVFDDLILAVNRELEAQFTPPEAPEDPAAPKGEAKKKPAPPPIPRLQLITPEPKTFILRLPPQFAALTNLNLTIALGKKHLMIGTAADLVREALALEPKTDGRWAPTAQQAETLSQLPAGLRMLQISDPSTTVPEALATLPTTIQATSAALSQAMQGGAATAPGLGGVAASGAPSSGSRSNKMSPMAGGGLVTSSDSSSGSGAPLDSSSSASSGSSSSSSSGASSGLSSGSGSGLSSGGPAPAPGAAPAPGGLGLALDPTKAPSADEIRPLLFPGSTAMTADDQGFRITSRSSFPEVSAGSTGIATALLLPAVQSAREAARRAQAGNAGAAGGGSAPSSGPGGVTP